MKYLFIIGVSLVSFTLSGQELENPFDSTEVFTIADTQPEFPGGMEKLYKFLVSKMKYPQEARKNRIGGIVYVGFVIEKDGSVEPESVAVIKGVHRSLDEEGVRVIKLMPDWIPGSHRDRPVRIRMILPITFKI